jgi:hypothetical protein
MFSQSLGWHVCAVALAAGDRLRTVRQAHRAARWHMTSSSGGVSQQQSAPAALHCLCFPPAVVTYHDHQQNFFEDYKLNENKVGWGQTAHHQYRAATAAACVTHVQRHPVPPRLRAVTTRLTLAVGSVSCQLAALLADSAAAPAAAVVAAPYSPAYPPPHTHSLCVLTRSWVLRRPRP